MFTIRVEPGKKDEPDHAVYACTRYEVKRSDEGRTVHLAIVVDQQPPRDVVISDGGLAYVMNAGGVTIDVVRTRIVDRR